jgi:hypothetical protein
MKLCEDCGEPRVAGKDRGDSLCFGCQVARLEDHWTVRRLEIQEWGITPSVHPDKKLVRVV